jgi:hypothetical protein
VAPIQIIVTSGLRRVSSDALPRGSVFFPKPYRDENIVAALWRMAA